MKSFRGALGLVLLVAAVAALAVFVRRGAPSESRPHAHPAHRPALPPPGPPPAAAPEAAPPAPDARWIRVRHPDGRVERVADGPELDRIRDERRERRRLEHETARSALRDRFLEKRRTEGAAAALGMLEPLLRGAASTLVGHAERVEAAVLLVMSAEEGDGPGRPPAGTKEAALLRLRSFLEDPAADEEFRRGALASLLGRPPRVEFKGDEQRLEDGEWVEDFSAELTPVVVSATGRLPESARPSELLKDPALAGVLLATAADPRCGNGTRATALQALSLVPDSVPRAGVMALAADRFPAVARAALQVLARSATPVGPEEFWTLTDRQTDPVTRSFVAQELGPRAFQDPGAAEGLARTLSLPAPTGSGAVAEAGYRRSLVQAAFEAHARRPEPRLLGVLADRLGSWAVESWPGNSPVVLVAREAASRRLVALAPALRAAAPLLRDPRQRELVEQALADLER